MSAVKLKEIASLIGAELAGNADLLINGVSSISSPQSGTVVYAENPSSLRKLTSFDDFVIIIAADVLAIVASEKPSDFKGNFLIISNPRAAFARVSGYFNPPYWLAYTGISPDAIIEEGAFIADNASIGSCAFVGTGSKIGESTIIFPGAHVGRKVSIGQSCVIMPGVVIMDGTRIGDRVIINPNAVIGSEGFGFAEDENDIVKVPQTGNVIIGDDVEIGACTTIDRGTLDDTVIGSGTKIDNLVQIGHNVKIGKNVRIASQAGFSGRVTIEDDVIIGGQAGFQNGVTVGKGTRIAGQTAVFKSLAPGQTVSGYPAMPHIQALKLIALTKRLPEIIDRIDTIEMAIRAFPPIGTLMMRRPKNTGDLE